MDNIQMGLGGLPGGGGRPLNPGRLRTGISCDIGFALMRNPPYADGAGPRRFASTVVLPGAEFGRTRAVTGFERFFRHAAGGIP